MARRQANANAQPATATKATLPRRGGVVSLLDAQNHGKPAPRDAKTTKATAEAANAEEDCGCGS